MSTEHHHHHHHHRHEKRKKVVTYALSIVAICFGLFVVKEVLLDGRNDSYETGNEDQTGDGLPQRYDGIDVSHHQGIIDWMEVARDSAIQFVYIKATEGSTHVDRLYDRNIREANLVGMNVGSYHYLTSQSTVEAQFNHFASHAKVENQRLRPMVDVEQEGVKGWSKADLQKNLALFCWYIKKHYGVYPVIYSYSGFYNKMLAPRFNKFNLFLARYNGQEPVVQGAGQHNIWQHTDQGSVMGISSPVDLDLFADGTALSDILISQ